ncbi:hypothetical protein A2U01_0040672 [Trifolium medium]|uniref:Uncharacterized protein n=1 Tax=Trifolium medium TaxID=97028 RepID=A0A392Q7J3_9FABA|nr:hypothetical protein [Trifolium medium]
MLSSPVMADELDEPTNASLGNLRSKGFRIGSQDVRTFVAVEVMEPP